jgi:hypothetical protein
MTKAAANVKNLGPGSLSVGGTDMGHVAGCVATIVETVHEFKVEAYGEAPVGASDGGKTLEMKVIVEECTKAALLLSFNEAKSSEQTSTSTGTDPVVTTATKVTFGNTVGKAITSKVIRFVPDDPAKTPEFDLTIHKGFMATSPRALPYSPNESAKWELLFRAMIDDTRTDGDKLFCIGDTSIPTSTS